MAGAVEAAREMLQDLVQNKGETTEAFASRMYSVQMEVYSAWAMTDLWSPFEYLPKDVQESWIRVALSHTNRLTGAEELK